MTINKKNIFSSLIFITSFMLIVYFIKKIDYEKFKLLFLNFNNYFFFTTYIICIIQTLLNVKKFNLLSLNQVDNKKLSKIFFISSFLNFILPFKLGEIKKIYLLKKIFNMNYKKSVEIMIVDKVFEIIFYIFFSVFIFSFLGNIESIFIYLVTFPALISLLFFKKILFFLNKSKINLFQIIKKKFLKYTVNFDNFKKIIILNILVIIFTFIHFKIFFTFLTIENFSLLNLISFVSLVSIIGFIPVTYNGLGFREFFILIIFGQLFTIEQIIIISIFFISRSIPSAIIGFIFFIENLIKKIN
jgi:glycosyltransferase 2 family protein